MLKITQRIKTGEPSSTLTLSYHQRVKARLRVILDDGCDAGLFLDRGPIIRGGDLLRCNSGEVIQVIAADESVSRVRSNDSHLLARACYHMGNRHVPIQILENELRYLSDHVLESMLEGLGLASIQAQAPFEPERGAYGEHGYGHSHDH